MGHHPCHRRTPARRAAGRRAALACSAALVLAPVPVATGAATADPGGRADAEVLLDLAGQGDARAAFLLGSRFASGNGGVRDDSEAARWFRQAAEAGLAEAQYNLGVLYAQGRGVERDLAEAARWYRRAAEQGIAEAQYNLGLMYGTGSGLEQDLPRAAEWLRRAGEAGLPAAAHNLGVMYEFGRGVPRDLSLALVWYGRALEGGYEPARPRLDALRAALGTDAPPELPAEAPDRPTARAVRREPPGEAPAAASTPSGPAPAGTALDGPRDPRAWTLALDPERYTVQLASFNDEESARSFLARHLEPGQSGLFASDKQGRRWYSVVTGEYETFKAARAAAAALPEALRKGEPWVRKVRLIHATMVQ